MAEESPPPPPPPPRSDGGIGRLAEGCSEASSSSGAHPQRRHWAAEDGDPEQGRETKRRKEEDVGEEDMQIDVAELDVNLEGQPFDFNEPEGPPEIADTQYRRGGSTGNCFEAGRRENPALGGPLPLGPGRGAKQEFVESLGEDEYC